MSPPRSLEAINAKRTSPDGVFMLLMLTGEDMTPEGRRQLALFLVRNLFFISAPFLLMRSPLVDFIASLQEGFLQSHLLFYLT